MALSSEVRAIAMTKFKVLSSLLMCFICLLVLPAARCGMVGVPRYCAVQLRSPIVLYPAPVYQSIEGLQFCGCFDEGKEIAVPSEDEYFLYRQQRSLSNLSPRLRANVDVIRQALKSDRP